MVKSSVVLPFRSVAVFIDPVCGEISLGLFAMPAARAVKRLIAGVGEAAFAGIDLGLTIRSGAPGWMANRDPLGIDFEPVSHSVLPPIGLRPLPLLRQGVLRFPSRELFSARPLYL